MNQEKDLQTPKIQKREIFGWAMYDFANSSYTTLVISLLYATFFVKYIVPPDAAFRDTYWSIAIIASTVIAIIMSPLVGAICDYTGGKKRYLFYTTLICGISTGLLFLVKPGEVWFGIFLITISNAAFMMGEAFCASFLPEIATKKNMGLISGLGWGFGYLGGLIATILITQTLIGDADTATYVFENRVAMIGVGAFYFLAALPTFLLLKNRGVPVAGYENASFSKLFHVGISETGKIFSLAKEFPVLFKFFFAFTIYMAGLEVIIKFIGIYTSAELGFTLKELITMFVIIQITAALGAVLFGFLENKLGAKRTVLLTIVWWIIGILALFFLDSLSALIGMTRNNTFLIISAMAGAGIGSIQSSSRAVVGLLSPADRSAQMFGFWGMFMRLSIILGMSFGILSDAIGSRRYALLLVIAFFAIGGIMLYFVPIDEAIEDNKTIS